MAARCFFIFVYLSHVLQLTPQQQSAEPRNSAGAEALAVARRPKEASRDYYDYYCYWCFAYPPVIDKNNN